MRSMETKTPKTNNEWAGKRQMHFGYARNNNQNTMV